MQTARSWALTKLSHNHWDEYKVIYEEERINQYKSRKIVTGRYQTKAKQRLADKYRGELLALVEEGVSKGFPRKWTRPE